MWLRIHCAPQNLVPIRCDASECHGQWRRPFYSPSKILAAMCCVLNHTAFTERFSWGPDQISQEFLSHQFSFVTYHENYLIGITMAYTTLKMHFKIETECNHCIYRSIEDSAFPSQTHTKLS